MTHQPRRKEDRTDERERKGEKKRRGGNRMRGAFPERKKGSPGIPPVVGLAGGRQRISSIIMKKKEKREEGDGRQSPAGHRGERKGKDPVSRHTSPHPIVIFQKKRTLRLPPCWGRGGGVRCLEKKEGTATG